MEMKKSFYETPLCETLEMNLENAMLAGSPGEPGGDLNELAPLNY